MDHDDDSRAVGRVDWDHDGDVDLWISNRNGPQLRFMRNDLQTDDHFLALRLRGTSCNRDAIGARVELVMAHDEERRQIATLHAGDGYLAQSSKWLHFGLGQDRQIEKVVVHWPGGETEEFAEVKADHRYLIVQDRGRAESLASLPSDAALKPSTLVVPPQHSDRANVYCARPVPLPPLTYHTMDGQQVSLNPRRPVEVAEPKRRALLVNLWASWCATCVEELTELTQSQTLLREAGIDVIAISVDAMSPAAEASSRSENSQSSTDLLKSLGFPFETGHATSEFVDKLQMTHDAMFELAKPLPIPTSILIDDSGQLVAIYRGPVSAKRLVADVTALHSGTPETHIDRSLPFSGRRRAGVRRMDLYGLTNDLIEAGHVEDAAELVVQVRKQLARSPRFPALLVTLGNRLLSSGKAKPAVRFYRRAISVDAGYIEAHNNLAWTLATDPNPELRNAAEAVKHAEIAAKSTDGRKPSTLDTLSAAYAEAGNYKRAAEIARAAVQSARASGQASLATDIERRQRLYENGQPFRSN